MAGILDKPPAEGVLSGKTPATDQKQFFLNLEHIFYPNLIVNSN